MFKTPIGRMSTRELNERESELLALVADLRPDDADAAWSEIDAIRDELSGREHDLADPSSGLGLHQPTGSR